jgi:hypothetical protein
MCTLEVDMRAIVKPALLIALFTVIGASTTVHAAWIANGVLVCSSFGAQDMPVVVPDGAGGSIIIWRDDRTVNTDIYAQRVDAAGNLLWMDTGMPVCTAPNNQTAPQAVPDGAGGAIIAWQDFRSGSTTDIYAQRIDSNGFSQWTLNGIAVCTGKLSLVLGQMISDGAGGVIITWHDRRNFTNDVFAQRIDPDGAVMWTANGVVVSAYLDQQQKPCLASDGAGGAIIAWMDGRDDPNDIYAQRVNASGTAMWTADGVVVCNATSTQMSPRIIPDGAGGAIVCWDDFRNNPFFGIYAQRLSPLGTRLWAAFGVTISSAMYDQMVCRIVSVGSGEAVIMWADERSGTNVDIYAQKVDTTGAVAWTANGVVVCDADGDQFPFQHISNGTGGVLATWQDERAGTDDIDIYAQRIDQDGLSLWSSNGVVICNATANQTTPALATDGYTGAHIAWMDMRSGAARVYVQRVDGAGNTVVATMLQSYTAAWSGTGIRIDWILSQVDETAEFIVSRAAGQAIDFSEIGSDGITREGLSFSFIDTDCERGETYYYRVDVSDEGGGERLLFEAGPVETPAAVLTLFQNTPNPFNPSTSIRYYVPARCRVTLDVYSVSGDLVTRLYEGYREKGSHTAVWNGCDGKGIQMSSGVYLCRLTAGKETTSRKMILLR